jgi:WD40 repeat protein
MPRRHSCLAILFILGATTFVGHTAPFQTARAAGTGKDDFGDPLPDGAIARLGTTRLYHEGGIASLAVSADGKTAASGAFGRTRSTAIMWDIATGEQLRRFDDVGGFIAISPDGKNLAAAGLPNDPSIRVWDAQSGALRSHFEVKGTDDAAVEGIGPIALSPDGKSLVVETWWEDDRGMPDYPRYRKVRYIDLKTTEQVKSFSAPDDRGYFNSPFAISPDGKWLIVVGGKERTAYLVDVATMQVSDKVGTLAYECAFSGDSRVLAIAGHNNVRLVDLPTRKEIRTFTDFRGRHGYMPGKIAVSPDGSLLAVGGDYHEPMRIYDVKTGDRVFESPLHRGERVTAIIFSPDGTKLLSAHGNRLRVWDVPRGTESTLPGIPRRELNCARYSPNGKLLAVSGRDKGVYLYDAKTRERLRHVAADDYVASFSFNPGSDVVATAGMSLHLWDCQSGKLLKILQPGPDNVDRSQLALTYVEFVENGAFLLSGGYSGTIRLWDVKSGNQILEFQQPTNADHHPDPVRGAVALPESDQLAAIANKVYLYDFEAGNLLETFDGCAEYMRPMRPIAVSPDGSLLAFQSTHYSKGPESPYNVVLYEIETNQSKRLVDTTKPRSTLYETSVVFSPDGRLLATGGGDKSVRLWDVSTAEEIRRFEGHADHVSHVDFSPDGTVLVSASTDGTVLFWDAAAALKESED